MKKPRLGRPAAKLPKPKALITRRVRRLIDIAHDGNVNEASRASGVPYATLRDLYSGRSTNPSLRTLTALADNYLIFPGWFTDPAQSDAVPMSGWAGYLPEREEVVSRSKIRETTIPFAAWPLISVIRDLEAALNAMPQTRERPIWGDTDDEKEMNIRMSSFLLSPIIETERKTGKKLIYDGFDFSSNENGAEEKWISTLRALGRFWQLFLPEVIEGMGTR